jgi:predicted CoA-binding protein
MSPEVPMNDPDDIRWVLDEMTTWFVVGLGNNPARDAFHVARLLQRKGKRIVPIYPRAEVVHGEQGYRTIAEAAAALGAPDVVDVFVRSDRAGEFADQAIAAGAKVVWFQIGVIDDAAAARVEGAGLTMVMDRCPAVEYRGLPS